MIEILRYFAENCYRLIQKRGGKDIFTNVTEFGLSVVCYCGCHDCKTVTITMYTFRRYMATGFQTYKQINNWCNS
jgi:hypothetical protein